MGARLSPSNTHVLLICSRGRHYFTFQAEPSQLCQPRQPLLSYLQPHKSHTALYAVMACPLRLQSRDNFDVVLTYDLPTEQILLRPC